MKTNNTERHQVDLTTDVVASFPNGGEVVVYNAIERTTEDFHRILSCAKHFAQQGKQVVMPPMLKVPYKNPIYDTIFGTLRGTPYYGKCPDLIVDGVWYEHEGFTKPNPKSNFSNMLRRGLSQSDRIIIEKCGLSDGYMKRNLLVRINEGQNIKEMWVKDGEDLRIVFKAE